VQRSRPTPLAADGGRCHAEPPRLKRQRWVEWPGANADGPLQTAMQNRAAKGRRRLVRYEFVGPIGQRTMGMVCRARDTRFGRDVSLKVLPADLASDPDGLAGCARSPARSGAAFGCGWSRLILGSHLGSS